MALYHQGAHLLGLVSTGHRYWLAHAAGAIANNTWNNVGLRWDEQTGLEVSAVGPGVTWDDLGGPGGPGVIWDDLG